MKAALGICLQRCMWPFPALLVLEGKISGFGNNFFGPEGNGATALIKGQGLNYPLRELTHSEIDVYSNT